MGRHSALILGVGIRALALCAGVSGIGANAGADAPSEATLRIEGGTVTAQIRAMPLAEVARRLAVGAGVDTRFETPGAANLVIAARFAGLAMGDALHELFKDTAHAIVRDGEGDGHYRIHVYSPLAKGAGAWATVKAGSRQEEVAGQPDRPNAQATTPEAAGPEASHQAPMPAPLDPSELAPEDRVSALTIAVADGGQDGVGLVLEAANDTDASVRTASAELMLGELRDRVPVENLSELALSAPNLDIRLRALEALAGRSADSRNVRAVIESARHDRAPEIRQQAENLLMALDAAGSDTRP